MNEAIHLKKGTGPCEVHEWPTEDLPRRLIAAMRERHGRGGLNVCSDCVRRARDEAQRVAGRTV